MLSQVKMVSDTSSIFMTGPLRSVVAEPGPTTTVGRYRLRCVPSQRGLLLLFLQPQNGTVPASSALNSIGEKPLPLCEPSQKGWLPLLPHAHHQYDLPASTSIRYGLFWATTGCAPDISFSLRSCWLDAVVAPRRRGCNVSVQQVFGKTLAVAARRRTVAAGTGRLDHH